MTARTKPLAELFGHPARCRAVKAAIDRRRAAADDHGISLVEVLIASTLMLVLFTSIMVTMDMLNTVNNSVSAQSQEFEQALPALAPLQNLVRAEVEPAPPATANGNQLPSPGFQPIGNFSLTFYADIGTAYNNVTSLGTTGGPVKVVAQEVDKNGNPVTSSTTCSTVTSCNFQVAEYLPQIINGVSTCPIANQGGTACSYGATGTGRLLVNVVGLTNNPNPSNGTIQPIFTYNVFNPTAGIGCTLTGTCSVTPNLTSNVPSSGNGSATACQAQVPSGTTTVAQTCNDYIQSVGIELIVARKGAGTNGSVDEQSVVYRYAQSSGSTYYPYQPSCFYDASVSCPS